MSSWQQIVIEVTARYSFLVKCVEPRVSESMRLGSLSRHNKDLERRTLRSPRRVTVLGPRINCVIALRQISVTALFYLEDSRRIHPGRREEGRSAPVWGGGSGVGGERGPSGPSFYVFFFPLGLPCAFWAWPGCQFHETEDESYSEQNPKHHVILWEWPAT